MARGYIPLIVIEGVDQGLEMGDLASDRLVVALPRKRHVNAVFSPSQPAKDAGPRNLDGFSVEDGLQVSFRQRKLNVLFVSHLEDCSVASRFDLDRHGSIA